MNKQRVIKFFLASAAVACCSMSAIADPATFEVSGTVESFKGGGWGSNHAADIGQSVTFDFSYDSANAVQTLGGGFISITTPIDTAGITGGVFGSGINLESNGPGSGSIADAFNLASGTITTTASTSVNAPGPHFTGSVSGFSLFSDGSTTTVDLIENVFSNGRLDRRDSGSVALGSVSIGPVTSAPEIDPATGLSALTLLAGSLLVMRSRQSRMMP